MLACLLFFLSLVVVICLHVFLGKDDWSKARDVFEVWSYVATACGVFFVAFTLFLGIAEHRENRKANAFNTIVLAYDRIANPRSYALRGYLHEGFVTDLSEVVQKIEILAPKKLFTDGKFNCAAVESVHEDRKALGELHRLLQGKQGVTVNGEQFNALQVVELVLQDFDFLAIAYAEDIHGADRLTELWRPVFSATADKVVPFVAIERRLRGDPSYKRQYLVLLKSIGALEAFPLEPPGGECR